MKKQDGISLIELLIASAVGLVLLAVAVQLYLNSKQAYVANEGISRLQENGRIAIHILNQEIRTAGFVGCAQLSDEFALHNDPYNTKTTFNLDGEIIGYRGKNNSWSPSLPPSRSLKRRIVPGTDALLIKKAAEVSVDVLDDMSSRDKILVSSEQQFKKNDVLLISDCVRADIFKVQSVVKTRSPKGQLLTSVTPLSERYKKHAEVGKFLAKVYFIGKTGRTNETGKDIYGLYVKNLVGRDTAAKELLEGIANMQLKFGVADKDQNEITEYRTADQIAEWKNVQSVDVALMLGATDDVLKEWDTYVDLRSRA